eukprot:1342385-Amorphochlora_amoeboformis.AAC.1
MTTNFNYPKPYYLNPPSDHLCHPRRFRTAPSPLASPTNHGAFPDKPQASPPRGRGGARLRRFYTLGSWGGGDKLFGVVGRKKTRFICATVTALKVCLYM